MKFIKSIAVIVISVVIVACQKDSANNANTNANLTNSNSEVGKISNTAANVNSTPDSTPKNTAVKTVESTTPTRIAFNKGSNWGAVNITLAPGAAQKFVVSAKSGQTMDVEASSKETSINLIKGKAETTEDFGFLNAVLVSNGDYVFEVRNGTKKEIKTSVKVTIVGEEQYERGVLNDVDEEKGKE
jgi:hypothetical protein